MPTDVVTSSIPVVLKVNVTCAVLDTVVDVPYGLQFETVLDTRTSGDALVVMFTITLS